METNERTNEQTKSENRASQQIDQGLLTFAIEENGENLSEENVTKFGENSGGNSVE